MFWLKKGVNPDGPKKVWVPKSTPIAFDVGVVSHKMWEYWCLDGGCVSSKMVIILYASLLREVLVGGPPWFEDLETSSFDFCNYL